MNYNVDNINNINNCNHKQTQYSNKQSKTNTNTSYNDIYNYKTCYKNDNDYNNNKYNNHYNNKKYNNIDNDIMYNKYQTEKNYMINKDENINYFYFIFNYILSNVKEPIIIIILYILLSQNIVKNFFGNFINEINPKNNGNVSFTGVLIYGLIFSILYIILKNFKLKM
jgi:hypothetical protein